MSRLTYPAVISQLGWLGWDIEIVTQVASENLGAERTAAWLAPWSLRWRSVRIIPSGAGGMKLARVSEGCNSIGGRNFLNGTN